MKTMRIGPGLAGAAILVVGLYTLGRLVGWWLGRSEEITARQRSVFRYLGFLVPPFVMWATPALFRVFPVGYELFPSESAVVGALLNSVIAAIVAVLGLAGALWGLRPFRSAQPMIKGELWRRRRLARGFIIGLIFLTAVAIEFSVFYSVATPELLFGMLLVSGMGSILGNTVATPMSSPSLQFGVRRPTDSERDRIERVYERLDIPVPDAVKITVESDDVRLAVLQNDDKRVLALSDAMLSTFDDEMLSVGIAHGEGRAKHRVNALRKPHLWNYANAFVFFVWFIGAFIISLTVPSLAALWGAILLVGVMMVVNRVIAAWGRERIYLADMYMINRIDDDTSAVTDIYLNPDLRRGVVCTEPREKADSITAKLLFEPTIQNRLEHMGLTGNGDDNQSDAESLDTGSTA